MVFSPTFRGMERPMGVRPDIDAPSKTIGESPLDTAESGKLNGETTLPSLISANTPKSVEMMPEIPTMQSTPSKKDTAQDVQSTSIFKAPTRRAPILLAMGGMILGAGLGANLYAMTTNNRDSSSIPTNPDQPVASNHNNGTDNGIRTTEESIEIPPFLVVQPDGCKKVVKASVPPITYIGFGAAKIDQTTVDDQPYTVTGIQRTFSISTCGLSELPIISNQLQPNSTVAAQLDISSMFAVVKPSGDAEMPKITADTAQSTLTEFGYGDKDALCTFVDSISGCSNTVELLPKTIEHEQNVYTALAANLALKQCGAEAYEASVKKVQDKAVKLDIAGVQFETSGLDSPEYINNGTAAIVEASAVDINELNQKSPEVDLNINCKVTD